MQEEMMCVDAIFHTWNNWYVQWRRSFFTTPTLQISYFPQLIQFLQLLKKIQKSFSFPVKHQHMIK